MLSKGSILTGQCVCLVKKLQTNAQLTAREEMGEREDGCRRAAPHAAGSPPQPGATARPPGPFPHLRRPGGPGPWGAAGDPHCRRRLPLPPRRLPGGHHLVGRAVPSPFRIARRGAACPPPSGPGRVLGRLRETAGKAAERRKLTEQRQRWLCLARKGTEKGTRGLPCSPLALLKEWCKNGV